MGRFGIGQPVRRVEDHRLLTGSGRYTGDIVLDRQAWGHVLRSPHAHAAIRSVDPSPARAIPGVLAVYTAADIHRAGLGSIKCLAPATQPDGSTQPLPPHPILADGTVRHVGDPVAFIVAETPGLARDAIDAVMVDYDPLPAVVDPVAAIRPNAVQLHTEAPGNVSFRWEKGDRGGVDAAFDGAAHVVQTRLVNSRIIVNPIETRVAIGAWDGERFTLYTPSQGPHSLRRQLAADIFGMPEGAFHVVTTDVGGSFGMKIFLYAEQPLVLLAARDLGRPVKWVAERAADGFLSDNHARDQINEVELALDGEARFLALRVHNHANMGAYLSNFAPYIPTDCSILMNNGVYTFQAIHVRVTGVFTNTVAVDAYRGAGRPEAIYLLERTIDAAARELRIDPAELRRRNFIASEAIPFTTVIGATYDSGDFVRNLEIALDRADRAGFAARKADSAARGMLRGFGIAYYIENCGSGPEETARIRAERDGTLTLTIGTQDNGQGHQTSYTQIIAERLGIGPDRIRVVQGDTDRVRDGAGTGGSRSLPVGGVSCDRATAALIESGKRIAADMLEAATADIEFAEGVFSIAGTDRRATLAEIAAAANDPARLPDGETPGLSGEATHGSESYTFPNGCHICEVEVDPETGRIAVERYVAVDDFGAVVNPLLLAGQVYGGIAQGIGQALHESCVYDENGQLLSGSFMDYGLPRADDLPNIEFVYHEDAPCRTNALGLKGAGEAGAVGAPPAVMNAILDALSERGVAALDMPATPERVWRAIREAA
ncbi:MAG: xanthine dehydrogenase family protein molybdopterin-binding subunit [Alphaproteobacteria bacterium]|nr:xanthine dehydrogenase family protein molybdopterin-binding subunit [Alphaproteobacteria bacterium]